jgi:hypothetical protein
MRVSGMAWLLCCGSLLASGPAWAFAAPPPAAAFPSPAPSPFAIALSDVHVADTQPHFAFDGRGNSIRAWTRWNDTEQASDVEAELVDAHGQPRGAAFQVNTHTPGWQAYPAVAMNARGRSVVAWQSLGQDGQISGIYAQIYTPSGARFGGEIAVSSVFPRQSANLATVGIDRAGNFAVAWYSGAGAFLRLFNPRGVARGPEVKLSPAPAASNPSLVMRPDGSFAVVWRSFGETGPGVEIFGRFFDAAGAPLGNQFQINASLIPDAGTPAAAAMPDGGLVAAWDSCDFQHPEKGCGVRLRRFSAKGVPLSGELAASPHDSRVHFFPAIAADGLGNAGVSWDNCLESGPQLYDCGISIRFYDPQAKPAPQTWNLRDTQGDLLDATITAQPGGFVVGLSASAGVYGWNFLFM